MSVADFLSQTRIVTSSYGPSIGSKMMIQHAWRRFLRRAGRRINFGQRPLDADWDVLIVLDACRADLFQEFSPQHEISSCFDSVDTIYSCASSSPEWFLKGFQQSADRAVADVAYVTQNPHFENVDHGRFHDTMPLYRTDADTETGLLSPSDVTDAALYLYAESTANRFVVHYMPPHAPFQYSENEYHVKNVPWAGNSQAPWWGLQTGKFTFDEVWQDYGANLLGILDEVERLVEHVHGDVVITSDHANAMGEWGLYGHPKYVPAPIVKSVPWVKLHGQGTPYDPKELKTPEIMAGGETVEGRLKALGYR